MTCVILPRRWWYETLHQNQHLIVTGVGWHGLAAALRHWLGTAEAQGGGQPVARSTQPNAVSRSRNESCRLI